MGLGLCLFITGVAWCQSNLQPPDLFVPDARSSAPFVVSRYSWFGAYYVRTTAYTAPFPGRWIVGVGLDEDNSTLLVLSHSDGISVLAAVGPGGSVTTLYASTDRLITPPVPHQSGDMVAVKSNAGGLCRIRRDGSIVSTIAVISARLVEGVSYASADLDTGDYFVSTFWDSGNDILRITERGLVTTLAGSSGGGWYGRILPDYKNGDSVSLFSQPGVLFWARLFMRPFRVLPIHQTPFSSVGDWGSAPALFQSDWVVGMVSSYAIPTLPSVRVVSAFGGPFVDFPVTPAIGGGFLTVGTPEIVGRRKLAGRGPGNPGTIYELLLSFPGEPNTLYHVGASLALRPGLTLANGAYIPLYPDAVFLRSLSDPLVFENFSGRLGSNARATARLRIPPIPGLRGLRLFLAAVTYDSSGVRTVSEPIGVTLQ